MPLSLYSAGGEFTDSGYRAAAGAMVNERWVLTGNAPFSIADLTGKNQYNGIINTLRGFVAGALTGTTFLNTSTHTGGSIEGVASYTTFTKATILAAAGVGGTDGFGNRNWTNVPSDGSPDDLSRFSSQRFGSTLPAGVFMYKQHLNEIIQVCRLMSAHVRQPSGRNPSLRYVAGTSIAHANALWDAMGWFPEQPSAGGATSAAASYSYGEWNLTSYRRKYDIDLSLYSAGTCDMYLKFDLTSRLGGTKIFGQTRPTTAGQGLFGLWSAAALTVGGVRQTPWLLDQKPTFIPPSDAATNHVVGCDAIDAVCIVKPDYTYT